MFLEAVVFMKKTGFLRFFTGLEPWFIIQDNEMNYDSKVFFSKISGFLRVFRKIIRRGSIRMNRLSNITWRKSWLKEISASASLIIP